MSKRAALVLGSGGARGYAHIGVIDVLRERGYEIVGVSGSSMGALVGGLQAAGKLDEYAEWARSLTQRAVLRLLDPSITAPGVLRAGKILDAVRDILGEVCIEDLPIPYTAVATDLIAGKSVWLQRGPVDAAIRASIAIPGVITPHVLDGRLLADGGILDPLPMAPVAAVNADVTVAVSLGGSESGGRAEPDGAANSNAEWLNRLLRSTSALLDTKSARAVLDTPAVQSMLGRLGTSPDESDESDDPASADAVAEAPDADSGDSEDAGDAEGQLIDSSREVAVPRLGSFEVMNRTIDIAQAALARHTLAAYPPDLLIEVPRSVSRSLDFHRAAEVIEVGRRLAADALDDFEKAAPQLPQP
ncbi:patatin-like phospholipase family protein [Mycobacterium sp. WMMD1722]|uniref:patatin-like phospholipase family protein n=1 Tax=Mycobacterium sp. WMMD1722 TaxID=3404117 RepID=UPI003BF51959